MKTLFAMTLLMAVLFSFGISAYASFFKISLTNVGTKVLTFLTLGVVATVVTLVLCLTILWPPVM